MLLIDYFKYFLTIMDQSMTYSGFASGENNLSKTASASPG
jgi:hypothetical protein